jgi:hypothetical protein
MGTRRIFDKNLTRCSWHFLTLLLQAGGNLFPERDAAGCRDSWTRVLTPVWIDTMCRVYTEARVVSIDGLIFHSLRIFHIQLFSSQRLVGGTLRKSRKPELQKQPWDTMTGKCRYGMNWCPWFRPCTPGVGVGTSDLLSWAQCFAIRYPCTCLTRVSPITGSRNFLSPWILNGKWICSVKISDSHFYCPEFGGSGSKNDSSSLRLRDTCNSTSPPLLCHTHHSLYDLTTMSSTAHRRQA